MPGMVAEAGALCAALLQRYAMPLHTFSFYLSDKINKKNDIHLFIYLNLYLNIHIYLNLNIYLYIVKACILLNTDV